MNDRSVSMAAANLYALVFAVPAVVLPGSVYVARYGMRDAFTSLDFTPGQWLIVAAVVLAGVVVHEALHGIGWAWASGLPLRQVRYGVNWKALSPYAHFTVPMPARAYRIGSALPGLVLGGAPLLASLVFGHAHMFWFGVLFTLSAGGDMLILWLIRDVPPDAAVQDHPSRAGCLVERQGNRRGEQSR